MRTRDEGIARCGHRIHADESAQRTHDATGGGGLCAELPAQGRYPYHYDQGYTARLAGRGDPSGAATAAASVRVLADLLKGVADVRAGNWYPSR